MRGIMAVAVALAAYALQADEFQVGFSRVDVTPPMGIPVSGYFNRRVAEGVKDPLEAVAVSFSDGTNRAIVMAVDNLHVVNDVIAEMKTAVSKSTGLPVDAIFIHSTHTHTGPATSRRVRKGGPSDESDIALITVYDAFLVSRMADAAKFAFDDQSPASLSFARTEAKRISFGRRYLMKDGKVRTNPGVLNPDIVRPDGNPPDDQVQLLRIDRKDKPSVAIVNFQTHPDTVGGSWISGDWPALLRRTLERALDGEVRCLFLNGAQGDLNHVCVDPKGGELNGLKKEFDNVYRGYDHAKHMAAVLAGAVMSVWYKCEPLPSGRVRFGAKSVRVPSQRPSPGDMEKARLYSRLHREGRDSEIPFTGMELTTELARAARMMRLENGPDYFDLPLSAVSIGESVAFGGFPGEPFNEIGKAIKGKSPFRMTIVSCLTNGSRGYFPFSDAYASGGYESATSNFGPSVADDLIAGQLALLNQLILTSKAKD